MKALRQLVECGTTRACQQCATAALFELDEEQRGKASAAAAASKDDDGSGTGLHTSSKPPPHIMMSYNWTHQDVVLRVVTWLQGHGYIVWVDTEQMKGSTVDTMALAVEGSEVMLIGMSRQYKESSNCRMEAQYGLQKKKPLIPLKLVHGYEADGWLGLMLGTSMWYALYGETLSSESAFEDRMSALSREIGSRGRADAVVAPSSAGVEEPEPWADDPSNAVDAAVVAELRGMKVGALTRRAIAAGVD
jgi:hypothetical protein